MGTSKYLYYVGVCRKEIERILKLLKINKKSLIMEGCTVLDDAFSSVIKERTQAKVYSVSIIRSVDRFISSPHYSSYLSLTDDEKEEKEKEFKEKSSSDFLLEVESPMSDINISSKSVDFLFLAPPIEPEKEEKKGVEGFFYNPFLLREESIYIRRYAPTVREGGVIACVVAQDILSANLSYLISRFKPIAIYKTKWDGESKSRLNNRFVFVGQKRIAKDKRVYISRAKAIKALKEGKNIIAPRKLLPVEVSYGNDEFIKIKANKMIDPGKIIQSLDYSDEEQFIQSFVPKTSVIKPLMPPREGHLALLVSTGIVNGKIDENTYVLGKTEMREFTEEIAEEGEFGNYDTRVTQKAVTVIKVLKDGKLFEVK